MKRFLYILCFFSIISFSSFAQDDDGGGKLREKMTEYIQQKLGLSKGEAERFSPVFLDYFKDLKRTNREFKGDRLILQQKIVELRLRYRDQFKPIVGEKRSSDVFEYERDFVQQLKDIRKERLQDQQEGRSNKRFKPEL